MVGLAMMVSVMWLLLLRGLSHENARPPLLEMQGLGREMMVRCIEAELGGSVNYDWLANVSVATVPAQTDRLAE